MKLFPILAFLMVAWLQGFSQVSSTFPSTTAWVNHYNLDILPFWLDSSAYGKPVGNFPTFRQMDGKPAEDQTRYVRMLSRQVYTYYMGYHLTGDIRLLSLAQSGLTWIHSHAKDADRGFFTKLDQNGSPVSTNKTAQDLAYITSAFGLDYYITKNPESKKLVQNTIRLVQTGPFYNAKNDIVNDMLSNNLDSLLEFNEPSEDLVSVLDQINAFLLLYTNQLAPGSVERKSALQFLHHLGDMMVKNFYSNGLFWNTVQNRSDISKDHVDAGHTLKSFWMLHRISELWKIEFKQNLYDSLLAKGKSRLKESHFTSVASFWASKFDPSFRLIQANPDWWIQIEQDQYAADLCMYDTSFIPILNQKATTWLASNFIDRNRSIKGIRNGIKQDNSLHGDSTHWQAKANEWKNGYHETEHALVLHIASHKVLKKPLTLYYALPLTKIKHNFQPYLFSAKVEQIKYLEPIPGTNLMKVAVTFLL